MSGELARRGPDSWTGVLGAVAQLAEQIQHTEFVPKALSGRPAAITATVLYGREIGLPPMLALRMVRVIEGTPTLSAEGMRALALAAGHEIEYVATSGHVCRVRGRRAGSSAWHEVEWTLDAARAAGLAQKQVWRNYPRAHA